MRPLAALPKVHLHLHLEGAMRPATFAELAAEAGSTAPVVDGASGAATLATAGRTLTSLDHLRRLVLEVVEDAAAAGVVWVEPSFDPRRLAARLGGAPAVLEAVLEALSCAGARHGIGTGLMVAAGRSRSPGDAADLARLAVRYAADGVVSFGLDPDDARHPLADYGEAFATARHGGLLATPHAGAADGPEAVAAALSVLGADRIQHGLRAVEDPDLVVRLADGHACLDVCPTADVGRGRYPTLADHPLVDLLAAGVRCSVNAPDPLLFGTGLLDELAACRHDLDLDDEVLAAMARTAIEASGAPDALKAQADVAVGSWLADEPAAAVA